MDQSLADQLQTVLTELSSLAVELADLPTDAFEQRFQVRQRQEALRERARLLRSEAPDSLSAEQLRHQIAQLEQMRDSHRGTHLTQSAAAQTGEGGGIDPYYVHKMNAAMDKAVNLDRLNEEIRRLRDRLATLDAAPPDAAPGTR